MYLPLWTSLFVDMYEDIVNTSIYKSCKPQKEAFSCKAVCHTTCTINTNDFDKKTIIYWINGALCCEAGILGKSKMFISEVG